MSVESSPSEPPALSGKQVSQWRAPPFEIRDQKRHRRRADLLQFVHRRPVVIERLVPGPDTRRFALEQGIGRRRHRREPDRVQHGQNRDRDQGHDNGDGFPHVSLSQIKMSLPPAGAKSIGWEVVICSPLGRTSKCRFALS